MQTVSLAGTPLIGLIRELRDEAKLFVKQEFELARNEMLEKISAYRRNAVALVIGGVAAYAGVIVLLGGLGVLAGFGFQKLDLDPALAMFIGLAAVGLLTVIIGGLMVLKAIKGFSKESLAPEKTMDTFKHLKGTETVERPEPARPAPKRSSEEVRTAVLATEDQIGQTLEEIARRASPARLKKRALQAVEAHPYRWSFVAVGSGVLGGLLLTRKLRRL